MFKTLRIVLVAYVGLVALLMIFETSLVFPGSPYPRGNWEPEHFQFEEVSFDSADGTKIVGWYLPKLEATETILLCHGNAENAAQASGYMGLFLQANLNANVFVYDYRGYGKSEGTPAETGILQDSEAALKWLEQKDGKSAGEVIIVGHSIGGGPACYLASKYQPKVLVLQQTFSSLVDAASAQYPWVPVGWLMKNRFPSGEHLSNYEGPLFQSHGTADRVVAFDIGKKLFEQSASRNKVFFTCEGEGHYDPLPDKYWEDLNAFIVEVNHAKTNSTSDTEDDPGTAHDPADDE